MVLESLTGFAGRCVLPLELHAQLRLVAVIVVIVVIAGTDPLRHSR